MSRRPVRALVIYAAESGATLSYQRGWPRAFAKHPAFEVTLVDLLAPGLRGRIGRRTVLGRDFEVLVLLHSVFSNARRLDRGLAEKFARLPQPKALFVGNEYKLMPEKMDMAAELRVSLLVSQLTSPRAHALYGERLGCAVAHIPSAGLDPEVFRPLALLRERPLHLGYRGYRSPLYLGHDERVQLVEQLGEAAALRGLHVDLSLDPSARLDEAGWAAFLNRCRGQLGSEAGGDYFELTDELRIAVNTYVSEHPGATIAGVRERFFAIDDDPVSGRALSGRVVEAAGTKTVQLLLEGEFGGYFQPDLHYIAIRHDYSNVDDALDRLLDDAECERLTEAAYEVAITELTYERLIDRFRDALEQVL